MKKLIKKILTLLAENDLIWFFLKPFAISGVFLFDIRRSIKRIIPNEKIENLLFQELNVQNGPFKGMKYPKIDSVGSSVYPKLLGCYEKELWEVFEEVKGNNYSEVINVGCAEGYYAVGLAMNLVNANHYAYDISKRARILCEDMARLNNVFDRMVVKSECTAKVLESFKFTGKGLIICDCEGFEKELFNKNNVLNLKNCDLVIETHDAFDITISTYLKDVFNETHDISVIKSIDDIEKALTYDFKGLEQFDLSERKQILAEGRVAIAKWFICKPKI